MTQAQVSTQMLLMQQADGRAGRIRGRYIARKLAWSLMGFQLTPGTAATLIA